MAIEVCDGWPADVENNLDYWVDTLGQICFWSYTVVAELGDISVPRDLTVLKNGSGSNILNPGGMIFMVVDSH